MRRAFADWPPVLRPPRPYLIITTSNLSADSVAPERQSHFMLDLGAADADVAQQPVVEFAQLASLARTVLPAEESIEEARDKAIAGLGAQGTHEV